MCSVYGALLEDPSPAALQRVGETFERAKGRGRDSWGLAVSANGDVLDLGRSVDGSGAPLVDDADLEGASSIIGTRRAEPTTEWIRAKRPADVQPFCSAGGWLYSLNGTISNDRELLATLAEDPSFTAPTTTVDAAAIGVAIDCLGWDAAIRSLEGSFAIVAASPDTPGVLHFACNYKPMFVIRDERLGMVELTSQAEYLVRSEDDLSAPHPREVPPYSIGTVSLDGRLERRSLLAGSPERRRVLAVCSGGLDSVVAAWQHHVAGDDVALLHIDYGCKARVRERQAVERLSAELDWPLTVLETDFFRTAATSVLTDPEAPVATAGDGERPAELGTEWVPARNTVLMAMAMAYAEAHAFDCIALGNNLEESSGGFPDNEQEFVNKLQALAPYALRPYRPVAFSQPCGALMKREIVTLAHESGVPLHLTWSCYEGGDEHCGRCGPCFMRIVAHLMAGLIDPVFADRWEALQARHTGDALIPAVAGPARPASG